MKRAIFLAAFLTACSSTGDEPDAVVTDADMETTIDVATPVDCGENQLPAADGCVCEPGFERVDEVCELVPANPPEAGELLIEELYYSGAAPTDATDHYFADQFVELVNTTDHPLDLSGVMIADVYGVSGAINPGTRPDGFAESLPDQVVLQSVFRIPAGTRLEAGARFVIAQDGTNHRPFSTIDLSAADFETYVAERDGDDDHPTVPNLEIVEYNSGFDWLVTVFGPAIVILEADTELGTAPAPVNYLTTAPTSAVLDAIEALMDETSADFKRLPTSVDAGFGYVADTYVGESLQRRQEDGVFQDTDDTSADFVVSAPDPGRAPDPRGVFGDPWIELGTGLTAFEALDDGDPLAMVAGIQGGWHFDASVRFGGFGPEGVLLVYEAVDAEAQRVSFVTEALLWEESVLTEDDGWARVGDRIVLDVLDPTPLFDQPLILRVTAELEGQTWSDELTAVVQPPD